MKGIKGLPMNFLYLYKRGGDHHPGVSLSFLGCFLVFLLLVTSIPPVLAMVQEDTYSGVITGIAIQNNTILINVNAVYRCEFPAKNMVCGWTPIDQISIQGGVPDSSVFSYIKPNDNVEVTMLGGGTKGYLTGIGRLVSQDGKDQISDFIGDPLSIYHPLQGDYNITYSIEPDCGKCGGSVCPAISSSVTLFNKTGKISTTRLFPNDSIKYQDPTTRLKITLVFLRGQGNAAQCPSTTTAPGPYPTSLFRIHIERITDSVVSSSTETSVPSTETSTSPVKLPQTTVAGDVHSSVFLVMGSLGLLWWIRKRKVE
jgi:hypothetical protein